MIAICPKCKSKLSVDETMIGNRVQCAGCRHFFTVPPPPGYTPPAADEPAAKADEAEASSKAEAQKPARRAKAAKPASKAKVQEARPSESAKPDRAPAAKPLRRPAAVGKLLVLIGLSVVLLARGGNIVAARGVDRAKAKRKHAENQFADKWQEKIENAKPAERSKLNKERTAEQQKLTKGEWRTLTRDARDAEVNKDIYGYWLAWLYVIGSIALVVGLLLVAFHGTGAERLVCLIMIAIITFSIYVGGLSIKAM